MPCEEEVNNDTTITLPKEIKKAPPTNKRITIDQIKCHLLC
jgi:hypothetical protein